MCLCEKPIHPKALVIVLSILSSILRKEVALALTTIEITNESGTPLGAINNINDSSNPIGSSGKTF